MFGVVLWSDCAEHRAVIWCEDHGELAYYDAMEHPDAVDLLMEPGDLVKFDLGQTSGRMRVVRNPSLVAEKQYPTLASELKTLEPAVPETRMAATGDATERQPVTAIIIPFASEVRRRAAQTPPSAQRLTVV